MAREALLWERRCCLAKHTRKVASLAMELRHLRYFVAVAEEENITRAATRLHVSQPPLSRQIRDLEDELGIPLFTRSAKAVKLTVSGRVFLDEARAVLARADAAVRKLKAAASGIRGELHVGYAPSLTVELLPLALQGFQRECPAVRVNLHDLSTAELLTGLAAQKLDVALMIQPCEQDLRGLRFEVLRTFAMRVAVARQHPLARKRQIRPADLAGERLIAYTRADYPEYHEVLERLFHKLRLHVTEEHDSATSLIAAVEAGRGLALVPESFACFAGPRVTLRPLTPAPAPLEVGVAHLAGKLTPQVTRFLAILRRSSGST